MGLDDLGDVIAGDDGNRDVAELIVSMTMFQSTAGLMTGCN